MKIRIFHKFLILVVLIAIIPLFFLGLKVIDINSRTIREFVFDIQTRTAQSLTGRIDRYIEDLMKKLLFVVNTQEVRPLSWQEKEGLLKSLLAANRDFVTVSFVNSRGEELKKAYNPVFEEYPELINRSRNPVFQSAKDSLKPAIGEVFFKREDPRMNVFLPSGREEFIFVEISLRKLWDEIENTKIGTNGFIFLVDDRGRVICNTGRIRAQRLEDVTQLPLVREVLSEQVLGSGEFVGEDGERMLGAYSPVESLGWGVIIYQPREEAYVSVRKMKRSASFWILVIILAASIGGFFFAKNLSRPIVALTGAAKTVAAGNFTRKVRIKSRDEIGEFTSTFNFMIDKLQEYKDMHIDELLKEKKKTEAVLFSIMDGIIMTDFEGNIQLINEKAQKIFPLNVGDNLIENIQDRKVKESFKELLHSREESFFKEIDLSQESSSRFLKAGKNIVKTASGRSLGIVTVLHDITLEKEIARMKEDFMNSVTHDLRNPLTSIHGTGEILLKGKFGTLNEKQAEVIGIMNQAANKLLSMIENILDVARMNSGRLEVELKEVNIREIIERVMKLFSAQAEEEKIGLSLKGAIKGLSLECDENLIQRVLTNLVGNALKFTPSGGDITVSFMEQEPQESGPKYVEVSVSDTGEGIPREYRERIFEKFQQVDKKIGHKGAGLGLTISKYIVEQHRGKIWVESEGGQGSRFIFRIPKSLKKDANGEIFVAT